LVIETIDEEYSRATNKKKVAQIPEGITTYTDPLPDVGYHQRTKTFDPVTGNISDQSTRIDDLVRASKLREKQEWEEKLAPYHEVQNKLDVFRHNWHTKPLESIESINNSIDDFLVAFRAAPDWVKTKIEREEFPKIASHLKAYEHDLQTLLGFINNLSETCKELEKKKKQHSNE
jgi:hypothetical protein